MPYERVANEQTLEDALAGVRQRYAARNGKSLALHERALKVMPGGNTRSVLHFDPFPLYMAASEGCWLVDSDDHRYLDVLGEYTAGLYGHRDPLILAETQAAAERGAANGGPGAGEISLAEQLCARFPALDSVRFCNSGTEANLFALTLAGIVTGRSRYLAFVGGYHGGVLGFSAGVSPMNVPLDWRLRPYNDPDIETVVLELGDSLAAVILEPMLSNGGCLPARPEFLRALRRATEKTGALLIFDEVVTSRMSGGGLQQQMGVTPDLMTLGKYLGAGFSCGAFGGRADLMARFDPRRADALGHAGTFNNNVFSMSVGAKALSEIFPPERADLLCADGETLRARLNRLASIHCPDVQFTGYGSVMNIHFVRGEITSLDDLAGEDRRLLDLFHFDMMEAGLYNARRGQINLSLPMGQAEFTRIAEAVEQFLVARRPAIEQAVAATAPA